MAEIKMNVWNVTWLQQCNWACWHTSNKILVVVVVRVKTPYYLRFYSWVKGSSAVSPSLDTSWGEGGIICCVLWGDSLGERNIDDNIIMLFLQIVNHNYCQTIQRYLSDHTALLVWPYSVTCLTIQRYLSDHTALLVWPYSVTCLSKQ